MVRMLVVVAVLCLPSLALSVANPSNWEVVASFGPVGAETTYYADFMSAKYVSGQSLSATGKIERRQYYQASSTISIYRWTVSAEDCLNGYGVVKQYRLNGTYDTEIEFAANGGNVGSSVGEAMCRAFTELGVAEYAYAGVEETNARTLLELGIYPADSFAEATKRENDIVSGTVKAVEAVVSLSTGITTRRVIETKLSRLDHLKRALDF